MTRDLFFWHPFDERRIHVATLRDSGEVIPVAHSLTGAERRLVEATIDFAREDNGWRTLPAGQGYAGPQMVLGEWRAA